MFIALAQRLSSARELMRGLCLFFRFEGRYGFALNHQLLGFKSLRHFISQKMVKFVTARNLLLPTWTIQSKESAETLPPMPIQARQPHYQHASQPVASSSRSSSRPSSRGEVVKGPVLEALGLPSNMDFSRSENGLEVSRGSIASQSIGLCSHPSSLGCVLTQEFFLEFSRFVYAVCYKAVPENKRVALPRTEEELKLVVTKFKQLTETKRSPGSVVYLLKNFAVQAMLKEKRAFLQGIDLERKPMYGNR